ncbi:MAG: hypothetical protein WAR22_04515 [Desulfomonilia bacterium]|jgi:hypothetical protein
MNNNLTQGKTLGTSMTKPYRAVRWVLVIFLEIISLPAFIIFSMRGHLFYALAFGILTFVAPIWIMDPIRKPL